MNTPALAEQQQTDGLLPQFAPPGPNSWWTVSFAGPNLQCREPRASYRNDIENNILQASSRPHVVERQDAANETNPVWAYRYVAWTAGMDEIERPQEPLPFVQSSGEWIINGDSGGFDVTYLRTMQLNLALLPGFLNNITVTRNGTGSGDVRNATFKDSTFLQCNVVNASYDTRFECLNGVQHIDTKVISLSDDPMKSVISIDGPSNPKMLTELRGVDLTCDLLHSSSLTSKIVPLTSLSSKDSLTKHLCKSSVACLLATF